MEFLLDTMYENLVECLTRERALGPTMAVDW